MAPRSAPNAAEAAYRRFLAQQKEGLRSWAKRRAALLDEVGMSADMEQLVVDLLEELRDEPAALAGASLFFESPLNPALLLLRCLEPLPISRASPHLCVPQVRPPTCTRARTRCCCVLVLSFAS